MQISFFSFDCRQRLTATGVKYPVRDLEMRRWHVATLNEAVSRHVSLHFDGEPVLVFRELR